MRPVLTVAPAGWRDFIAACRPASTTWP